MRDRKDYVVALGCSFTDENFLAYSVPEDFPEHLKGGWPMWPEIFTDRLSKRDNKKYRLINHGKSGSSMPYSFRKFYDEWNTKKGRLKAVLWGGTSWSRFEHETRPFNCCTTQFDDITPATLPNHEKDVKMMKNHGMYEYVKVLAQDTGNEKFQSQLIGKILNQLVAVKDLCEAYGISFLYYPLFHPLPTPAYSQVGGRKWEMTEEKTLLRVKTASPHAYDDIIKSRNFLGVSTFSIGWVHWVRNYIIYKKYRITDNKEHPNWDGHPNKEGQVTIADEFWRHYEKYF